MPVPVGSIRPWKGWQVLPVLCLTLLLLAYLPVNAQPVVLQSDTFTGDSALKDFWRVYNPRAYVQNPAVVRVDGSNVIMQVPQGIEHNAGRIGENNAPRILQRTADTDFAIEVKFDSMTFGLYQLQGIVAQQTNNTYLSVGVLSDFNYVNLTITWVDGENITQILRQSYVETPRWIRLTRSGDMWQYSYSTDGARWFDATVFTLEFTVTEVGVYAGNAGLQPPRFTASVDYFMNMAQPVVDEDLPDPSGLVIDLWYGNELTVGQLGIPQNWVNILGRVHTYNKIRNMYYILNGGSPEFLGVGPNTTRLQRRGDFNVEIGFDQLTLGANQVILVAEDVSGLVQGAIVNITYDLDAAPQRYTRIHWDDVTRISEVAAVVDGLWELVPGGVRVVEPGYDRLLAIGDLSWQSHMEVFYSFTVERIAGASPGTGFAFGWQGHVGDQQPRVRWPLQAITWLVDLDTNTQMQILLGDSQGAASVYPRPDAQQRENVTYMMRSRSTLLSPEVALVQARLWEAGTPEPTDWEVQSEVPARPGSLLFIVHFLVVTIHDIEITYLDE